MAIWFYIRTRLRHSVLQSASILLLFAVLIAFFSFFEGFLSRKEKELDTAWNTIPVTVTVSNLTGTKTDDLDIHGYLVSYFLSDVYYFEGRRQPRAFSTYFRQVKAVGSVYYSFGVSFSETQKLIGMTEAAAEARFSALEKGRISFFQGYDSVVFSGSEPVCIVPDTLLEQLTPGKDGRYSLILQARMIPADQADAPAASISLEVVGSFFGTEDAIYCPWAVLAALQEELDGKVTASSLSATVRDNRELDELRPLLLRHFAEVDPSGRLTEVNGIGGLYYYPFAATVHDEALRAALNTLNRNLRTMYALRPVFALVECTILSAAVFFFVYARRRELAAMRSLGTRRRQVLGMILLEMSLFLLPGLCLGLLAIRILPLQGILRWGVVGGMALAAQSGAAIAALTASGKTGVRILREEE